MRGLYCSTEHGLSSHVLARTDRSRSLRSECAPRTRRIRQLRIQTFEFICIIYIIQMDVSSCIDLFFVWAPPAHIPVFRRILSTVFTFRIVPSVRSGGFCSQHPRGHADRSCSSSEKLKRIALRRQRTRPARTTQSLLDPVECSHV